ncbi:MAG: hypothetical protein CMK50_02785, partial [Propionibacteriaceae bacterium]|nr:hypothetical protein [Propionibacteriaceae bacterium]
MLVLHWGGRVPWIPAITRELFRHFDLNSSDHISQDFADGPGKSTLKIIAQRQESQPSYLGTPTTANNQVDGPWGAARASLLL